MSTRRSPRSLFVLLVLLLAIPSAARSEDAEPAGRRPLTFAEGTGGRGLLKGLPAWSWRPGHTQLIRQATEDERRTLVALDPATNEVTTLLDLTALGDLVDRERPIAARGIGRSSRPHLCWAPSGNALCVVVKGDLVWVDLESDARRRLTETTSPLSNVRVAPGGRHVLFVRDHDLWAVATAGGEPIPLTVGGSDDLRNASLDWVYPEELGIRSGAWWSPDASKIAWLQLDESGVTRFPLLDQRVRIPRVRYVPYPKAGDANPVARLGVVGVEGGETTWLDLGTPKPEYVCRVTWLPDNSHVVVVTLDRTQRDVRILACPVDGGAPSLLLEAPDGIWSRIPPAPEFVDDHRFLWRGRRDGCTRWYVATVPSEAPGPVTLAALTAADVDVPGRPWFDPVTGSTRYVGMPHGALRTRCYAGRLGEDFDETPPAYAPPEHFTVQAGLDVSGAFALVTVSNATTPSARDLRRVSDGAVIRDFGDARGKKFETVALAVPEFGTFDGPAGPIAWRLWKPQDFDASIAYPAIVRVYAGPGTRSVRDTWGRGIFLNTLFTQHGFLVIEVDGRGSSGHGTAHEEAVRGQLGVFELEDQALGVQHLAERPYVDGERIGITGWSFGGTMTCLALTSRSDVFRAGVAIASVTDWRLYDTIYTERYMGLPKRNAAGYRDSASTTHAKKMAGNLLLLHGALDDNVHVQNTQQLVQALVKAGKTTFESVIYPGCGHGLSGATEDAYRRMIRYFEEHL